MSALFWNLLATKYAKSPVVDEAAYQRKLEVTRGYFTPDMEVLEIGCGTGSTAVTHAPHVKHIRAVDISSKMLEIARGKADAKRIKNVTFERSSIDGLSVLELSLDAVLGLSILHLLRDKQAAIAKVHQMLNRLRPVRVHRCQESDRGGVGEESRRLSPVSVSSCALLRAEASRLSSRGRRAHGPMFRKVRLTTALGESRSPQTRG